MELKIDKINKHYKNTIAINNINIKFTPGIWGILGANGAGKSTLIETIVGNIKPTSGEIFYNGKSIVDLNDEYRNIIGYLPQKFSCDSTYNVYDYLEYMAALKGIKNPKNKIDELIKTLELEKYTKRLVSKLSGGTKQRVGIAQALLNNPSILILDEPTSGLDPKERIRFRGIISKLADRKIILLSTHIVSDIETISTNNVIIRDGKIIDIGPINSLLDNMNTKVWEIEVTNEKLNEFEANNLVINIKSSDSNTSVVRFISKDNKYKNAIIQKPNLEDYYIWILKERK
ncbi:MAG: ATP-binding cassette domain-containing protein [Paraclostridium sp.]